MCSLGKDGLVEGGVGEGGSTRRENVRVIENGWIVRGVGWWTTTVGQKSLAKLCQQ